MKTKIKSTGVQVAEKQAQATIAPQLRLGRARPQSQYHADLGNQSMSLQPRAKWNRSNLVFGLLIAAVVVTFAVLAVNLWLVAPAKHSSRQPYLQSIEPLPFGPGWAADYGTYSEPQAPNQNMPFGPGWAATYGAGHPYRLPFGPGLAATYGAPTR